MRRAIILIGGAIILVVVNWGIYQNERVLEQGRLVLLELAPIDPRSLMQGDYMALRFKAANAVSTALPEDRFLDGALIVKVDDRGVGEFDRVDDGTALAPNEVSIRFRVRAGQLRFTTDAYFFQEGQAELFESARYGAFKVAPSGKALLTDLYDESLVRLGTGTRP